MGNTKCTKGAESIVTENEIFRTLWDTAPDAIALTDPEGIILQVNEAWINLLGYRCDELIGHSFTAIYPEDPKEEIVPRYEELFNTPNLPTIREVALRHKEGTEINVEVHIQFLLKNGCRVAMLSILRDVSRHKAAEQVPHAADDRFSKAFQASLDGLSINRASDGCFVEANDTLLAMLGLTREEVIGSTAIELQLWADLADRDNMFNLLYKQGYVKDFETRFRTKSGSIGDTSVSATFMDVGETPHILTTLRDITERKSAEREVARLAAIVEASSDAIISKSLNGTILTWNPGAEWLYGYTADEAIGHNISLIVSPDHVDEMPAILENLSQGTRVDAFDTTRARKDGTCVQVSVRISPIRDSAGDVIGAVSIGRDITEQKHVEEELHESRARFASIIEAAMDAMITVDEDQRIILFNIAAEQMFGYPASDMIGQQLDRLIPKQFRAVHQKHIHKFGDSGATSRAMGKLGALSGLRADGEEFPIEASISQVESAKRRLYTVILRDITQRKQVEEQLQYQANLTHNVSDAIISTDVNYVIESWNKAAETMYGWQAEEVIGKFAIDILQTDYILGARHDVLKTLEETGIWQGEVIQKQKYGAPIHVHASVSVLRDSAGNVIGTVTANRDITERKRWEERQNFLAKASATLASSQNYETTLAALSQLAVTQIADWCIVRLATENGVLDLTAFSHRDPNKLEQAKKASQYYSLDPSAAIGPWQVVRSGRAEFLPELTDEILATNLKDPELLKILQELRLRSAMTVPMIVHGRTLGAISLVSTQDDRRYTLDDLAMAEELAQRVAFAVDNARLYRATQGINERLEERVTERTAELETANKELESFSYSVSHDLRAPLSHILGFVNLLQSDSASTSTDSSHRYLDNVADAATQMGTLIDDLLAFSRVGRTDLKKVRFEMKQLVQEVIAEFEQETRDRHITWQIGSLPGVNADRAMLRLAWANLISNALKYTRKESNAEIEVGYYLDAKESVFFVRDNGVGFNMKYIDKLFGVFQRLHSITQFEGTGIGLANIRRIVARHGGRTWAEGSVNVGATFYFSLPNEEALQFKGE